MEICIEEAIEVDSESNPSSAGEISNEKQSKWELVGYSGVSPGLENAVKGGAGQLGLFVFLFTSMRARSFSPTSEFTG